MVLTNYSPYGDCGQNGVVSDCTGSTTLPYNSEVEA